LTGRYNFIYKSETGKCAVRLFERRRPYDYDQSFVKNKQDLIAIVEQEKLVFADTNFHRLQQAYKALKYFDFDSILLYHLVGIMITYHLQKVDVHNYEMLLLQWLCV